MKRVLLGVGFVVAWAAALVYGVHSAMRYESTPGAQASRKPALPTDKSHEWTCVMVAHPLCPCTKTSLIALRAVMAKHPSEIACHIVFAGQRPEEQTTNMEIAASIPGVRIEWISADDAQLKYHALTSGQTFVYRRSGELVFSGGVTPGRGVDQPMFALGLFDTILSGALTAKEGPVFGCSLGSSPQ